MILGYFSHTQNNFWNKLVFRISYYLIVFVVAGGLVSSLWKLTNSLDKHVNNKNYKHYLFVYQKALIQTFYTSI